MKREAPKAWYNSQAWRNRRAEQLANEPLCRYCRDLFKRTTPGTVADHLEPHRGDPVKFWEGALQTLCRPCHSGLKQGKERTGIIRGSDALGNPIDPDHPWNRSG